MTNTQLYLAIGVPILFNAVLVGFMWTALAALAAEVRGIRAELIEIRKELASIRERVAVLEERDRQTHPIIQ